MPAILPPPPDRSEPQPVVRIVRRLELVADRDGYVTQIPQWLEYVEPGDRVAVDINPDSWGATPQVVDHVCRALAVASAVDLRGAGPVLDKIAAALAGDAEGAHPAPPGPPRIFGPTFAELQQRRAAVPADRVDFPGRGAA